MTARVGRADRLEVGIQLPVQARSEAFVRDWERDAGPDELVEVACAADDADLLYVGVCDHVAIPDELVGQMGSVWYDAVATLGLLAGVTTRVRLLTHVYVPVIRHPLMVAKAMGTVDHLSKGRLVLGVGAGHVAAEMEALGADHSSRGARTDEAIDALVAIWTNEAPRVDGPTWSFEGLTVAPRPEQAPHPPIWIGGSSPAAQRRAGLRGSGWLPQGTPLKDLPAAYEHIRRTAADAGRSEVELELGANGPWLHVGDPPPGADTDDRRLVIGSADRIAAVLRRWLDAGADHVQVAFPLARSAGECADQIRRFGAEVAPQLVR